MAGPAETRSGLASELIRETRDLEDAGTIDRNDLETIRLKLQELAAQPELWSEDDYPAPTGSELHNRYRIDGEGDSGITLYLNVLRSGKTVPPHNHTTWACIAAVEGVEHNLFYRRTDDRSVDGKATIEMLDTIAVQPGVSVAMMPEDIHNFEVRGQQTIRHLHFYGRPLEKLSERKAFDMENDTYKIMDVGVKTIT
jgi:predicted metal-dependent enzyme (double-stranded beta helix superfamily)